jgi:hypothetical protein
MGITLVMKNRPLQNLKTICLKNDLDGETFEVNKYSLRMYSTIASNLPPETTFPEHVSQPDNFVSSTYDRYSSPMHRDHHCKNYVVFGGATSFPASCSIHLSTFWALPVAIFVP